MLLHRRSHLIEEKFFFSFCSNFEENILRVDTKIDFIHMDFERKTSMIYDVKKHSSPFLCAFLLVISRSLLQFNLLGIKEGKIEMGEIFKEVF